MAAKKRSGGTAAALEHVQPKDRAAWRAWLAKHHDANTGVWLVYYKKSSGKRGLTYDEAVEEALCYGWIDSHTRRYDEARTMLLFTPRKPKSVWSASNKARVERLIRERRMTAIGLAKIEAAKADGSWNALDEIDRLVVPPDLRDALARHARARAHFEAFPPSARKLILLWIASAKRPETRAKRIEETVRLAAKNIRAAHPPPRQ